MAIFPTTDPSVGTERLVLLAETWVTDGAEQATSPSGSHHGHAVAGLVGILLGRWSADRLGATHHRGGGDVRHRFAVATAYPGGPAALAVGYVTTVLLASAFAPAQGTLDAELVPHLRPRGTGLEDLERDRPWR